MAITLNAVAMQDKYILTSMAILCCICVWHAVVPVICSRQNKSFAESADQIALIILGSAYTLLHLIFFLQIYITVSTWKLL